MSKDHGTTQMGTVSPAGSTCCNRAAIIKKNSNQIKNITQQKKKISPAAKLAGIA